MSVPSMTAAGSPARSEVLTRLAMIHGVRVFLVNVIMFWFQLD
jgi:hypothetical protein